MEGLGLVFRGTGPLFREGGGGTDHLWEWGSVPDPIGGYGHVGHVVYIRLSLYGIVGLINSV